MEAVDRECAVSEYQRSVCTDECKRRGEEDWSGHLCEYHSLRSSFIHSYTSPIVCCESPIIGNRNSHTPPISHTRC